MKFTTNALVMGSSLLGLANAYPQAVTSDIAPSATAPAGCTGTYSGSFAISVQTAAAKVKRDEMKRAVVSQIGDGKSISVKVTGASIANPSRAGQIQAPTGVASSAAGVSTVAGISVISDGQPQAPTGAGSATAVTSVTTKSTKTAVTVGAVSQISDGQIQAPSATTVPAVVQSSDGQVVATQSGFAKVKIAATSTASAATTSETSGSGLVTCDSDSLLKITLKDGVLTDSKNRTGYIASNYQFQFDDPPQAGAIYTGGFSVCGNGSLALGGSEVFYQCLSGDFYNLYDRWWAEQCEPISISAVTIEEC